jgi:hypothetical protein
MVVSKEILIRNIVKELKEIPTVYLENLYAIVHIFRTNLPIKEAEENSDYQEDNFDWDSFLEEISENRKENNLAMASKLDKLFAE